MLHNLCFLQQKQISKAYWLNWHLLMLLTTWRQSAAICTWSMWSSAAKEIASLQARASRHVGIEDHRGGRALTISSDRTCPFRLAGRNGWPFLCPRNFFTQYMGSIHRVNWKFTRCPVTLLVDLGMGSPAQKTRARSGLSFGPGLGLVLQFER